MEPMHGDGMAGSKLTWTLGLCCSPMPHGPIGTGPYHFIQLDIKSHDIIQGVCALVCVSPKWMLPYTKLNNYYYFIKLGLP